MNQFADVVEGLDIAEVDLIVFFEAVSSPTRTVQRMGRTGRQRNGRVVVLVRDLLDLFYLIVEYVYFGFHELTINARHALF